ncbi:MAG: HNH/ENDO VII family nuclease [Bacteroidales bacterium]|nr:HNH/ENDO VII family nuclease [Bacteroidales bacterium]
MSLTIPEKQSLRSRTGWSDAILDNIASREEAEIYIKAGLREARIGGRPALIRDDIDWSDYSIRRNTWLKEYLADFDKAAEYNNADLIGEGYPPRDKGGNPYELHHIGQHPDSPLAELTVFEHRENEGNYAILHATGKDSEIDRPQFEREKSAYWQARYKAFTPAEIDAIYRKR